ncbi:hypothetical protein GIB67_041391 [Kingdonia uniflora]|uniref:Protein kinase domain-containing protein n=1 Tax=Kingdonia uniflora TaxID=39325 RepID=A0A7J7LRB4_9MAGN|nr:hypothetical protein GIB67_041391 [Kingdonia uniflora]
MTELFTLKPLFHGLREPDQIYKICKVIGSPSTSSWAEGIQFANANNIKFSQLADVHLSTLIPSASENTISLISSLCSWDPSKRPTAAEALQHPFFQSCFYIPPSLRSRVPAPRTPPTIGTRAVLDQKSTSRRYSGTLSSMNPRSNFSSANAHTYLSTGGNVDYANTLVKSIEVFKAAGDSPPPNGVRGRNYIMKDMFGRAIAYKSIQLSGVAPEGFYRVIVDEWEVLNFWEVSPYKMDGNFYEMMKVVEGMNVELRHQRRGLIEWIDIISFYLKKANKKVDTYHIQYHADKPRLFDLYSTGRGWDTDLDAVRGNYVNVEGEDAYKLQHKIYNPKPGMRNLQNPQRYIDDLIDSDEEWIKWLSKKRGDEGSLRRVKEMEKVRLTRKVNYVRRRQQTAPVPEVVHEVSKQASKHRELGDDDAEDVDEAPTEAELEEHARVTAASMVILCANNPDEALRCWSRSLLRRRKEMAEQRETFQGKFNDECATSTRLKIFIEDLGYDPLTLKYFPAPEGPSVEGVVQAKKMDADPAGGGVGEALVSKDVAVFAIVDGASDPLGPNLNVEGAEGVTAAETVGGGNVATHV